MSTLISLQREWMLIDLFAKFSTMYLNCVSEIGVSLLSEKTPSAGLRVSSSLCGTFSRELLF